MAKMDLRICLLLLISISDLKMKMPKKTKVRKRSGTLLLSEPSHQISENMDGVGILSEIHPVAAGVYNTTYFVIVPHKAERGKYPLLKPNHLYALSMLHLKD